METKQKQNRINSKLLHNAVNWQPCYITCIYSETVKLYLLKFWVIILIVLWIVVFVCKEKQPGNPLFRFLKAYIRCEPLWRWHFAETPIHKKKPHAKSFKRLAFL